MSTPRSVVIHAHFYQPPREDPWLEEIPRQPSAAPFHDWNERIERECYRAVVAARIPDADGRIARIMNTLEHVSFDLGPTLLSWLETAAPATYTAMVDADRASCRALDGHGNALAAPFHHVILPLAPRRDKLTEVRWGIADFRRRFGREPEGLWLPETAVDDETLDVVAEAGIRFTMLAPRQVERAPAHGRPGLYRTAAGRTIAIGVYDGGLSHDVAFGPLVQDAERWTTALTAPGPAELITVATDGETFGHHHRFGEMALAATLERTAARSNIRIENLASWLARHPAHDPVRLVAPSSWSCAHGVDRWRADCGCRMDPNAGLHQRWRAPLRGALDWLAGELHARYEAEAADLFADPWATREAYGDVLAGLRDREDFLAEYCRAGRDGARRRAAELLELERHALGMFTSCGWFFDDLAGLESRQVLRYAARAVELAGDAADALRAGLRSRLSEAVANDPAAGTGADLLAQEAARGAGVGPAVAAGFAVARTVAAGGARSVPPAFAVEPDDDALVVRRRRTGASERCTVTVERPRPAQIRARITAGAGAGRVFALADLPERARHATTPQLVHEIVDLWLTEEEAAQLSRGVPLAPIAAGALLRAVVALADDASAMAVAQALDLTDLVELLGQAVPFDVQTAFHRIRPGVDPMVVAPLARRLGFA